MLEETSPGALNLSPGRIPGDPGAPGNCLQIVWGAGGRGGEGADMCIFLDSLVQSFHQILKAVPTQKS